MHFALTETDLLPAIFGGTADLLTIILEALLVGIIGMVVALWAIQKLATRHDPPKDQLF